jgi:hypothetical protein
MQQGSENGDPTMWDWAARFGIWEQQGSSQGMLSLMWEDMGPLWEDVAESGRRLQQKGHGLVKMAHRQAFLERSLKSSVFFAWKGIARGGIMQAAPHVRKKRKIDTGQ